MSLVEIIEEQQEVLNKDEFEQLISERTKLNSEIADLKKVAFVKNWIFETRIAIEVYLREDLIRKIETKLVTLHEKLNIETQTVRTDL